MGLYAGVTFLSAFLLFLVQPLLTKAVVPWFGGSTSTWTTSLVFYQTTLLVGYAYAHLSGRFRIGVQGALHAGLVVFALALLPVLPGAAWRPGGGENPTLHLLALLVANVGLPYLVLSATAPLLHDWFRRGHPGRSPYVLYAVSNAGSLLALLAYPFVVEPLLDLTVQSALWTGGFGVFAAGMAWLTWSASRTPESVPPITEAGPSEASAPSRGRAVLWFLLSACGSGLLLATTNEMTLDVASVPFLWVLPLAIYLLTYILAFAGVYARTWVGALFLGGMVLHGALVPTLPITLQVLGAAVVLFLACWTVHGELARSAPPARHLTGYYLIMSAGGAAGGAAVSLVAPLVLTDLWELPSFLLAAWLLLGAAVWFDPASPLARGRRPWAWVAVAAVAVMAGIRFSGPLLSRDDGTLHNERNFYGVLSILEGRSPYAGPIRGLRHGRVLHGSQLQAPGRRTVATTYYGEGSGVHLALAHHPRRQAGLPLRVGAVGLGVGTIAAWVQTGDSLRFYEIDPDVESLAREWFTYLDDSPAAVDVVLGDGRLELEREPPSRLYDVLVLDAFSSDAIPTHLLTTEAADLYRSRLAHGGVLAFHVTSSHLSLDPVVRGMATHLGLEALRVERRPDPTRDIGYSRWILMSADPAPYLALGAEPDGGPVLRWTDRFSNLLHVLR